MDFRLSEEHLQLQEMVRDFAAKVLKPKAAGYDASHEWPAPELAKCAEMGLMGIMIKDEYGGAEMDQVANVVVLEELNWADPSLGVIVSVQNSLVGTPIQTWGTEEQKRKYLPKLASGEWIGCYCLTEPGAGSDSANQSTTATKKGDSYVLNGSKLFITNGTHADVAIVFATVDKGMRHKGICAFIVERSFPGYVVGKKEEKLGLNSSGTSEIYLEDCVVPAENMLGKIGDGFTIAMHTLDGGRIGIAAQSLGIARFCLDESRRYSNERIAFGKPISELQAIQFKIADMATELEAARLLTYRAAWLRQNGMKCSNESAMAKVFASEMCNRAAYEALQVHGGYGYLREFPIERYYRDARITTLYEGTSEIQRVVIAKGLLKG